MHPADVGLPGAGDTFYPMIVSFTAVFALAVALVLRARAGHGTNDPRAFFAAKGQFGSVLYFMLAVGETYSIGTVLGFPAGVAAHGVVLALWFVGYILLAFPIGYVLYPMLWQAGRRTGAITLPDLFRGHFGSRPLERLVTGTLLVLMLPLGTMQFIGIGDVATHLAPGIPNVAVMAAAAFVTFGSTAVAGLRAPAMVAVLKDTLMLAAIAAVAFMAWLHHWHDGAPLAALARGPARPATVRDIGFVISTVLVQAVAFCIAPQSVAAAFSARDVTSIRRAQVVMPLYMLLFPLLFFIAAFATSHGTDDANDTFLGTARDLLPGWAFGIVLAATMLTGIVWLGAVCLSIAALVARNLFPGRDITAQKRMGLMTIAGYLALSTGGAVFRNALPTNLNTLFYLGLVQLVPGVWAMVRGRNPTASSIMLGLAGGFALAALLRGAGWAPYGLNPALIGICLNMAIVRITGRIRTYG